MDKGAGVAFGDERRKEATGSRQKDAESGAQVAQQGDNPLLEALRGMDAVRSARLSLATWEMQHPLRGMVLHL